MVYVFFQNLDLGNFPSTLVQGIIIGQIIYMHFVTKKVKYFR